MYIYYKLSKYFNPNDVFVNSLESFKLFILCLKSSDVCKDTQNKSLFIKFACWANYNENFPSDFPNKALEDKLKELRNNCDSCYSFYSSILKNLSDLSCYFDNKVDITNKVSISFKDEDNKVADASNNISDMSNNMSKANNSTNLIEQFSSPTKLILKGTDEYNKELRQFNNHCMYDFLTSVVEEIDLYDTGVNLFGGASCGKNFSTYIIGSYISEINNMDGYAYFYLPAAPATSPQEMFYGRDLNFNTIFGRLFSAFKFANENPNLTVVVLLDEFSRYDVGTCYAAALDLIKERGSEKSSFIDTYRGVKVSYSNNIYLFALSNVGETYENISCDAVKDGAIKSRFKPLSFPTLFSKPEYFDKFIDYIADDIGADSNSIIALKTEVDTYINEREIDSKRYVDLCIMSKLIKRSLTKGCSILCNEFRKQLGVTEDEIC